MERKNEQLSLFNTLTPDQTAVMQYLGSHAEAQVNRMSVELDIPVGRLMSALIELEFKELVLAYPGGTYRKAVP